jgi:predicted dehydrogenase
MTNPVRIALFGNSFGARVQLPSLRFVGGNEVVGIAGHDADKAAATAREWDVPRGTGDWRELLDPAPDLVLVSTPVDLHRPMTLAALDAGAAVLCEKPFALDVAEAEELVAAAAGRGAWIDHELRAGPHLRELRDLYRAGALGELWHASFEMYLDPARFRDRPHGWWFEAARGGGILGALGSHQVDTLRFVLGAEPAAVQAELRTLLGRRPDADGTPREVTADDLALFRLRFADGVVADVGTSIGLPRGPAFELLLAGSDGALRLRNGDELAFAPAGGEWEPRVPATPLPTCAEIGMPEYGAFGRSLPLYLRELLEAVSEARADVPDAASFADGLAVQRVLDAARRSSAAGGGWEALA